MEVLDDFLISKARDRKTRTQKPGWSKWSITKPGDVRQGWIRFHNGREQAFEADRQIVYERNGSYKIVSQFNDEPQFLVFIFDSAEKAKWMAENVTVDDMDLQIDFQRMTLLLRCMEACDGDIGVLDDIMVDIEEISEGRLLDMDHSKSLEKLFIEEQGAD